MPYREDVFSPRLLYEAPRNGGASPGRWVALARQDPVRVEENRRNKVGAPINNLISDPAVDGIFPCGSLMIF